MSGYTPIFSTMLEGTLHGRWPHTGVWACLLSMVDYRGEIDKHPRLIASAIGLPLHELLNCIKDFVSPDPDSRSPENEGRRLELIDPSRDWGWRVVNIQKYRARAAGMRQVEDGRNATKVKKYRDKHKTPADTSRHQQTPHSYSYKDSDSYKDKEKTAEAQAPIVGLDLDSWNRWVEYRKNSGKPIKAASIAAAQRKLASFGSIQSAVVEESIANGYQGLFPPKANGHAKVSKWE